MPIFSLTIDLGMSMIFPSLFFVLESGISGRHGSQNPLKQKTPGQALSLNQCIYINAHNSEFTVHPFETGASLEQNSQRRKPLNLCAGMALFLFLFFIIKRWPWKPSDLLQESFIFPLIPACPKWKMCIKCLSYFQV